MNQAFAYVFAGNHGPATELLRLALTYGCALALIAAGPNLPNWF